ncbi:hypothetical protein BKA81DRAFT_349254 [Phyllosticta paracitricarpa]
MPNWEQTTHNLLHHCACFILTRGTRELQSFSATADIFLHTNPLVTRSRITPSPPKTPTRLPLQSTNHTMSAIRDENATKGVSNQPGEFSSRVPPSEPLETGGHKPGVLASENDRAPEFHAQAYPPGSAPTSKTYEPNPDPTDTATGSTHASAADTIPGSTSASVHTGLGHPGAGQTSSELRHDGQKHRDHQRGGLAGLAQGGIVGNKGEAVSGKVPGFESQRGLDKELGDGSASVGQRGNTGGPAAEERFPVSSEQLASERQ